MSISMKRFVDITSKQQQRAATDRELILRIITESEAIAERTVVEYAKSQLSEDVQSTFGADSPEYVLAKNYFAYVSLTATTPAKISFYRPAFDETLANVKSELDLMESKSDNFGTLAYCPKAESAEAGLSRYETVSEKCAEWVVEKNFKFRYAMKVGIAQLAEFDDEKCKWTKKAGADDYVRRFANPGVTAVVDDGFYIDDPNNLQNRALPQSNEPEWLTCAILAATNYARANSTLIQEFKNLVTDVANGNMRVTCDSDDLADILSKLNVNFYGRTQRAGREIAFYMEGFNLDGTDTAIYDNEIWLKNRVETEVFNRFAMTNKVPAGQVGIAMVKSSIENVLSEGLNNLAVQPQKQITDADAAAIIQNTGDSDAPTQLYIHGYYLNVRDDATYEDNKRRVMDYILYYLTGEGIRKVTGSHVLV